ncbi:unnamed protein product [Symbiodinium pilosum]|uniref:Uncharacterized protein n=1 Tax=Symbiodinium pilosum TaxID=2952 RepID=A0A812M696_SYMPI|nr:unnamed protein product [Symbiodinium pilosum]
MDCARIDQTMSAPHHLRPSAQPHIFSRFRPAVSDQTQADGGRSVPFNMRPSAQPFISSRQQPSPPALMSAASVEPRDDICAVVQPAELRRSCPASSAARNSEATVAVFPSVRREFYRHMPSVGTWIVRLPGRQGDNLGLGERLAELPGVSFGLSSKGGNHKARANAHLEQLIAAASPSFDRFWNQRSRPSASVTVPLSEAVRFSPSVGTWLLQRPPDVSSQRPSVQQLQLQDGKAEAPSLPERPESRPDGSLDKEPEERLELHFFHLALSKVDPSAFKKELMSAFLSIGFCQDLLSGIVINLRAGSVIADIRGPASSMQTLKSLPVYSIRVMGCQAQSAASAAAMAAGAGVMPPKLPTLQGPAKAVEVSVGQSEPVPSSAVPISETPQTSVSGSPSAQLPLAEHSHRGTSAESRTPLLSGTPNRDMVFSPDRRSRQSGFRAHAAQPTERRKAGPQRLRARDRWNVEELRICDIMSRSLGWTGSQIDLEENDVAEILAELYGEELELDALPWTFQLASRGETRCTNASDLHYALRAHHICRFLPQATMRTLATTNVSSRGCVDCNLLRDLMEELNDGYAVYASQVNTVLDESEALTSSGSGSGRASLVRAISGWYLNVMRTESNWAATFRACYGRWVPENGYHWEVFVRFRTSMKEAEEAFHEDVWQAVWGLLQSAILLLALIFPTMFFAWLVVLGAEHGDDRCPKDLDGLITWFGMLGLALIVVGFVDGRLAYDDVVKTSHIGLGLTLVLMALPWVGAFWTFHLGSNDQQTCGLFLTGASSLLWTVCIVSELVLGFAFLWHLAVYQEYEMTLQQGNPEHSTSHGNRLRQDGRPASRSSEP